ncbi:MULTISPECIES: TetR/AcrR family transcriptional regulator [Arthrobacter]|uniref:TetR/AcrR family transcriptional regulator n=2 Tax=Arthrobacter TaxID=1663 RepID=A0ABU9KKJ8_9MICC|nr:TetR/AcrR family transcriptional regulator [Arthrobacter sp. YJM1]MDP5227321.1 TetR/AcrR family transcriptional regulator [Arthrobacter sp. YJM1]
MPAPRRRAQLIEVARSLFAEKGLDATSIEEIAAVAGVSKPVVYEHFGAKERLYTAVVEIESAALLKAITGSLAEAAPARVLLERAALALLSYIEQHAQGFRILVRDAPPSDPSGRYSTILGEVTRRVTHLLASEFGQRGYAERDAALYAQMLVGMVATTGQWWLDARTQDTVAGTATAPAKDEVAAHIVNLAWNGLTGLSQEPGLRVRG